MNRKPRPRVFRMGRAVWRVLGVLVGIGSSVLALAELKFPPLPVSGTQGGIASVTTSSSGVLTTGSMVYVSSYAYQAAPQQNSGLQNIPPWIGTINGWSGMLVAVPVTSQNGVLTATVNSDGSRVDGSGWTATIPATRHIFTAGTGTTQPGIPFTEGSLLNDPSGITGTAIDTINIVSHNPLGDIINSQLAFVGSGQSGLSSDSTYGNFSDYLTGIDRENVVYVGANDGMLHGFDAGKGAQNQQGSGAEVMAYVPRGLLGSLSSFDNQDYGHQFWVDGSPFSGDARINPNQSTGTWGWATVLVGTLGAGGRGYFVLDVTDPGKFSNITANAKNLVLMDATDTSSSGPLAGQLDQNNNDITTDIGNQFNQPVMDVSRVSQSAQIVQINSKLTTSDGQYMPEWAVIMGNGYNSVSGLPVLLIQSLSQRDSKGRLKIYMVRASCYSQGNLDLSGRICQQQGNGLGAPRAIDVDGNGTVDVVYAGDLMGNLWKFDISSPDHTQWVVAFDQKPMFIAQGPARAMQAITSAPMVVANPVHGGYMVAFGTGRNLTTDDAVDTNANSIYAIWDNEIPTEDTPYSISSTIRVPQVNLSGNGDFTPFCSPGLGSARYACLYQQTPSGASNTANLGDNDNVRGWYYDLPATGKVLANPLLLTDNILLFYSTLGRGINNPAPTPYSFNLFNGNAPSDADGSPAFSFSTEAPAANANANANATANASPSINFLPTSNDSPSQSANTQGHFATADAYAVTTDGSTVSTPQAVTPQSSSASVSIYVPNGNNHPVLGVGLNITVTPQTAPPRSVGWRFGR